MHSNSPHHALGYTTLPSSNQLSNGRIPSNQMHSSIEPFLHGSHYASEQTDHRMDVHPDSQVHRAQNSDISRHQYNGASGMNANGRRTNAKRISGPPRRRISRACDQCHKQRTKCDGQKPCVHCVEFGLECEYIRERKKRGRASRQELAQKTAEAALSPQISPVSESSQEQSPTESRNQNSSSTTSLEDDHNEFQSPQPPISLNTNTTVLENNSPREQIQGRLTAGSLQSLGVSSNEQLHLVNLPEPSEQESSSPLSLDGSSYIDGNRLVMDPSMINSKGHANLHTELRNSLVSTDISYAFQEGIPTQPSGSTMGSLLLRDRPLAGFTLRSDAALPGGWMSLGFPTHHHQQYLTYHNLSSNFRNPLSGLEVPDSNNSYPSWY